MNVVQNANEYKLDLVTLCYVSRDLEYNAKELERLANAGLVDTNAVQGQIKSMRAMSFQYKRMAEKIEDTFIKTRHESAKASLLAKETASAKRPRDFLSQAISFVLDQPGYKALSIDGIRGRIFRTPGAMELLVKQPTKAQVADALSAGSRGPNPRFLRVKAGVYKNNPTYKKARRSK